MYISGYEVSCMREKLIPFGIGLFLIVFFSWLLITETEPVKSWVETAENIDYDLEIRSSISPIDKASCPIAVVDIDDTSLQSVGRWPWPRKKMAELVDRLHELGAAVVAFDVIFPEPEANLAEEVIGALQNPARETVQELESIKEEFDYDLAFSKSLSQGTSILSIIFVHNSSSRGILPAPLLTLSPEWTQSLEIPNETNYLSNIPLLETQAKDSGFINASPDRDGILRTAPILLRVDSSVYGSLGLQAARYFLKAKTAHLIAPSYGEIPVLEGIALGDRLIPTNESGQALIPFQGPPYSFPYISAVDLLDGKVAKEAIANKIVFVGSTASALGDLHATPVSPVFPGIEIQASVALGIVNDFFPFKPAWGLGATLVAMIGLGLLCTFLFPFLGPLPLLALALGIPVAMILISRWLWHDQALVISVFFPILLSTLLFVLNIVHGFLFSTRQRKELHAMFGQYVPPAYLDEMLEHKKTFNVDGENKELTVLFADIFGFTTLSSKMDAPEIKHVLNHYFTPMTEIIFKEHGTIDKYIGDMIMAFWGAPIDDPEHAQHAVSAALEMQKHLLALNREFLSLGKPAIRLGIGVNTGIMNIGDMGSIFRRAYTVIGDAVNLGARIESLSRYYLVDTIVGSETWEKTKHLFLYEKLDKVRVHGRLQSCDIYTPLCRLEEATPEMKSRAERHNQAVEAYLAKRWDEAEGLFQKLKGEDPSMEHPYQIYLDRIAAFRAKPPTPDWDGTYIMTSK